MTAYYNENDPYAAQWLRNLIAKDLIALGEVDERDIREVQADEIRGFTQHHFFAGIGGWSLALRMASWPDDRPVFTGSCPCQPFSVAGRGKAQADERHLWPVWFNLIKECKPAIIYGEQVAAAITHGWLDEVLQALESEGYACGAAVLPATSVSRGHIRDRVFFVGNSEHDGWFTATEQRSDREAISNCEERPYSASEFTGASNFQLMAYTDNAGLQGRGVLPECSNQRSFGTHGVEWLECPDGKFRPIEPSIPVLANGLPPKLATICSRGFGNAIAPEAAAEFIKATGEL